MSFGLAIFVVVVFATFFNNALHFYTQVQTYPLFTRVGRDEFVAFHKEYQRRLPHPIYAPPPPRVPPPPPSARVGRDEFVAFHKEYQRRLPLAIYAPYSLLMAANVLL